MKHYRATVGSDDLNTIHVMITYARACQKAGQFDKAYGLLREGRELSWQQNSVSRQYSVADCAQYLALTLLMQHKYAQAEAYAREALAIFERHLPDDWRRFHAMNLLVAALAGQSKENKAEPLLLEGYEGLKRREDEIFMPQRQRLTESLERIVRFYEATGQPEKVREWQVKLERTKEKLNQ